MKWAMGALKYYVTNNPFILVNDHAPLLSRTKDHNNRVLRWYLFLLLFTFSVSYRAGHLHGNVNTLSQIFEPADDPKRKPTGGGVWSQG